MFLLMDFVFWKLNSEISSGFSGEGKAVIDVGDREKVYGRNTEWLEESSVNQNMLRLNEKQWEIALNWIVTNRSEQELDWNEPAS